jgi:hypothetical protein
VGFQFVHQFSLIINCYKDTNNKMGLVADEKLSVIKFRNQAEKTCWADQLIAIHSNEPPRYISWLGKMAQTSYIDPKVKADKEKIKDKKDEKYQEKEMIKILDKDEKLERSSVFYKLSGVSSPEFIHRLQAFNESKR